MIRPTTPYTPRFGSAGLPKEEGKFRKFIFDNAERVFRAPGKIENFFNAELLKVEEKQPQNPLTKTAKWIAKKSLNTAKKISTDMVNQEYKEFHLFDFKTIPGLKWLGHFKPFKRPFKLSTPGMGAALILYYVGLIYPRAHRAWQRGKRPDGTHDTREMMDVFRRDFWAITVFVYGLGTINRFLTGLRNKSAGVQLYNQKANDIYKYAEHDINAKITNGDVLFTHFTKKVEKKEPSFWSKLWHRVAKPSQAEEYLNRTGLIKAANSVYLENIPLPKKIDGQEVGGTYATKIQNAITSFRKALKEMESLSGETLKQKAHEAYEHLHAMDVERSSFLSTLKTEAAEKLKKSWPEYKTFFAEYVKSQRAPVDAWSFALLVVFLGYLPVKINEWWNNRLFEQDEAKKHQKAQEAQALAASTENLMMPSPAAQTAAPTPYTYEQASFPSPPIVPTMPQQTWTPPTPFEPKPFSNKPWPAMDPSLLAQQSFMPNQYPARPY